MPQVRCDSCQTALEIEAAYLGQQVQCGACGTPFTAHEDRSVEPPRRDWGDNHSDDPDSSEPRERYRDDRPDDEYAEAKVTTPAVGLIVTGGLGIAWGMLVGSCCLFGAIMAAAGAPGQPNNPNPQAANAQAFGNAVGAAFYGVWGLLAIAMSTVTLLGGLKLKRLSGMGLAMTGAILALVPCSPCVILGLPFGIIAIIAMNDPEVTAVFAARRRRY